MTDEELYEIIHLVTQAETPEAQLAILKPFLAQVWDDGLGVGLNYDSLIDNGYEPQTNPFKDNS